MSIGLLPIMWSIGTGADVMKRIAAPMVGGIFTSFLLELLVYPAIYAVWRQRSVARLTLSENIEEPSALGSLHQHEDRLVTLKL
jgi:Cu(I)/Ag(I) efflux system membrane protein CusA/SilA